MSYDIPHACNLPNDTAVFGPDTILDEMEERLDILEDCLPRDYADDYRLGIDDWHIGDLPI